MVTGAIMQQEPVRKNARLTNLIFTISSFFFPPNLNNNRRKNNGQTIQPNINILGRAIVDSPNMKPASNA